MSLFTRIVGNDENVVRIPVHGIQSSVSEVESGRMSFADVVTTYSLSQAEQADLVKFMTLLNNSTNKLRTSARIFNYLCLSEMGVVTPTRDYRDENRFWEMVSAESNNA